jgi:hypothetical protein
MFPKRISEEHRSIYHMPLSLKGGTLVLPIPEPGRRVGLSLFDIFSGGVDKSWVLIETVEGLGNAYERMTKIAARKPGPCFIFSQRVTRSAVLSTHQFQN